MRTSLICDGLLEVNEVGEVYKIFGDTKELAKITKTGRRRNYCTISIVRNGKQEHFYVHRLVAEAFIPNTYGYPEVNHIDGNPSNNRVDNLEWCSRSQNVQHAYRTGLINPYINAVNCQRCGEVTSAKDKICPQCKNELKSEAAVVNSKIKALDSVSIVDLNVLTTSEARCVELRRQGLSIAKIADMLGISRQCVDQTIKRALIKSGSSKKLNSEIVKEISRLNSRLSKNQFKISETKLLLKQLESQAEEITNRISLLKL